MHAAATLSLHHLFTSRVFTNTPSPLTVQKQQQLQQLQQGGFRTHLRTVYTANADGVACAITCTSIYVRLLILSGTGQDVER